MTDDIANSYSGLAARYARWGLFAFVILEIVVCIYFSTGLYGHFRIEEDADLFYRIYGWLPFVIRLAIFALFSLFVLSERQSLYDRGVDIDLTSITRQHWTLNAIAFLLLCCGLVSLKFLTVFQNPGFLIFALSPLLWAIFFATIFQLLSPILRNAFLAVKRPILTIGLILAFAILVDPSFSFDAQITQPLANHLLHPTMAAASWIYSLTGDTIRVIGYRDDRVPIFGNDVFAAAIAPPCAGYQGLYLTLGLISAHLFLERAHMTYQRAILLLTAAAVSILMMNVLRIALLMFVGTHISGTVAINGFHQNFGLVSVLLVLAIMVSLDRATRLSQVMGRGAFDHIEPGSGLNGLNKMNFVSIHATDDNVKSLLPLTVLLALSFLTGLVSGEFNWLYFIPVTGAMITAFYMRAITIENFSPISIEALGVGVAVFVIWIVFVPDDPTVTNAMNTTLLEAHLGLSSLWIIIRLIGSVLVVPLVEELAFRGAFQDIFTRLFSRSGLDRYAPVLATLLSALIFGFAHSTVFAGVLAGLGYGYLRLRTGHLRDAILAHATTNFLLGIFILSTQSWSLW